MNYNPVKTTKAACRERKVGRSDGKREEHE